MAMISLPPGFRFHPTDVELVWYYLRRKIMGKNFRFESISEVDIYKFAPWDLPVKSCLPSRDLEWYFFSPRDKKYANGSRINRSTDGGFWKTTGIDRSIVHNSETVGMKKTLIYHLGKPPRGKRTDWVMYEFRLKSVELVNAGFSEDAFVLCKIFQKSGPGPKNWEQYGAPLIDEDWDDIAENQHSAALTFFPCKQPPDTHNFSFGPIPSQSIEAGEPSSMPTESIASEAGEPSSTIALSEVRHSLSIPEVSCADVQQLQQKVNGSLAQTENANGEIVASPRTDGVVDGLRMEDIQAVFDELDDIPHQPGIGLDDFTLTDMMGSDEPLLQEMVTNGTLFPDITYDDSLDRLLSGFAEESYLEINDFDLTSSVNPSEFNNPSGMHDSNNLFIDGFGGNNSVPAAPYDMVNDDPLPTSEEQWSSVFEWLKDDLS